MSKSGSEERNLPASRKKLREARRKGQLPRSKEMVTAAVSVAALAYVMVRSTAFARVMSDSMIATGDIAAGPWRDALPTLLPRLSAAAGTFLLPLLGLLALTAVLTAIMTNGGIVFASDPVTPKMERLDPIAGLGRIFSLRNGTDAIKTVAKLILICVTSAFLLRSALRALVELPACGVDCTPALTFELFKPLILFACLLFLITGGLDLWLQRFLFQREQRMTSSEMKRDRRDSDGNPMIRQLHRQEQQASMQRRVSIGLRNASFVIRSNSMVLAFRYAPPDTQVPVLVAERPPKSPWPSCSRRQGASHCRKSLMPTQWNSSRSSSRSANRFPSTCSGLSFDACARLAYCETLAVNRFTSKQAGRGSGWRLSASD